MAETNKFIDPLDALIEKQKRALAGESVVDEAPTETPVENTQAPVETPVEAPAAPVAEPEAEADEIDYGENDIQNQIKQEEAAEAESRRIAQEEALAAKEEAKKKFIATNPHDPQYYVDAIDYQTEKLAIVTEMVQTVIKKHNLAPGEIPVSDAEGKPLRIKIMGELVDIYHKNDGKITPEFERLILSNWVEFTPEETKTPAPVQKAAAQPLTPAPTEPDTRDVNLVLDAKDKVNVSIDESFAEKLGEINRTKVINVHLREVTDEELTYEKIIENSQMPGLIKPYDSGINDVPVTLPMSGYRCVMRSINWFDFLRLTAPTSQNPSDTELRKWSVIYKHIKNCSIGTFTDFNDFLKKTKYQDKEILMWALLVATGNEEEVLEMTCPNEKCKHKIKIPYSPREILKIDEEKCPAYYTDVYQAAIGPEAVELWRKVAGKRRRYTLPHTGIIVELNEPSAAEFITEKIPLMDRLYHRYRPNNELSEFDTEDMQMVEFEYLSANALYISAMTIVRDGKEYRFTNWDDIETIITTALDADDSGILLKLIEKVRGDVSPASFYLSDITCPSCGHIEKKVNIDDIANTLLFQVSRRLANTEINLIEMDEN